MLVMKLKPNSKGLQALKGECTAQWRHNLTQHFHSYVSFPEAVPHISLPLSSASPSSSLLPSFSCLLLPPLLHPSPFSPVLPFALDLLCPPALFFMVGHQCSHPLKLSSPLSSLHQEELVHGSHTVSSNYPYSEFTVQSTIHKGLLYSISYFCFVPVQVIC